MSLDEAASRILALRLSHPVRVAVDGRTASGKTTFADKLAAEIGRSDRPVIRASIDGFHRPASERYRQGRLSSDGYYEDARDHSAIRTLLLDPLGPDGNLTYALASFNLEDDRPIDPQLQQTSRDAVPIVDGTFLQRAEFRSAWDFVIFLEVAAEEALRRGVERDSEMLDGRENAAQLYAQRYGPAFARYERECHPWDRADMVVS